MQDGAGNGWRQVTAPTMCGTCDHEHRFTAPCERADAAGAVCGCDMFVLHESVRAVLAEHEHRELVDFGGARTRLSPHESYALSKALDIWEASLATAGDAPWNADIMLLAVTVDDVERGMRFSIDHLPLPAVLWRTRVSPMDALELIVEHAEAEPAWWSTLQLVCGYNPPSPPVAWGVVVNGWIKLAADARRSANARRQLRRGEIRTVTLMDLDGRCYVVNRTRHDVVPLERIFGLPKEIRRLNREQLSRMGLDPDVMLTHDLPRGPALLLRLVGVTLAQIDALRAANDAAG